MPEPQLRARYRVAIVNNPMRQDVERNFLDNAIRGLLPLCIDMHVIVGNFHRRYGPKVHLIEVHETRQLKEDSSLLQRIIHNLSAQVQVILALTRILDKCDIVFYDVGEYRQLIAIIFAKVLRKTTLVYHHGGNKLLEAQLQYRSGASRVIPYIQECMLRLCYRMVDYVLCLSPSIVEFGELQEFRKKILFARHFVDIDRFKLVKPLSGKQNLIGYIGRITAKKGIMNIVQALPIILRDCPEIHFVIAGKGDLVGPLKSWIAKEGLLGSVTILPWIPDNSYPEQLSRLKFLLLPSYEEGVPATVLEAMACGVIPIVTPVGGIPDVVSDEDTGFLIHNNNPSSIAACVIKAVNSPKLDLISKRGAEFVRKEYSLDAVVRNYRGILESIEGAL